MGSCHSRDSGKAAVFFLSSLSCFFFSSLLLLLLFGVLIMLCFTVTN